MADNTSSTVGLFMTPELYQQERQQQFANRAATLAQLDPNALANFYAMNTGFGAGNALAGILGVQDPMMQALTLRNQVARQIDWTDPESIAKGAQALVQAGDVPGARQIAEEGRSAALRIAQTKKAAGMIGATTVSERNRNLIQQVEVKLAKGEQLTPEEEANARWLVAQETKPKVFRDSDTGEIIKIDPLDISNAAPNLSKLFGKQAAGGVAPTAAGVTTTAQTKVPPTIRKELGDVDQQTAELDLSIKKIQELTPEIDKVNLGLAQNVERGFRGFFGRPTEDTKQFKKLQREVLKQANNLLLLAKGTQTEGDAQRAKDQIADEDTWKNKDLLTEDFQDLTDTLTKTRNALSAKRQTLVAPGVPGVPMVPGLGEGDVAPKRNPLSGANPQLQPTPEGPKATWRYNPQTKQLEKL